MSKPTTKTATKSRTHEKQETAPKQQSAASASAPSDGGAKTARRENAEKGFVASTALTPARSDHTELKRCSSEARALLVSAS